MVLLMVLWRFEMAFLNARFASVDDWDAVIRCWTRVFWALARRKNSPRIRFVGCGWWLSDLRGDPESIRSY